MRTVVFVCNRSRSDKIRGWWEMKQWLFLLMKSIHSDRSATGPQPSSSPHTKGGKSPVCGHWFSMFMLSLLASLFCKTHCYFINGFRLILTKVSIHYNVIQSSHWTSLQALSQSSPWNSQAGIEGSPQDVLGFNRTLLRQEQCTPVGTETIQDHPT